MYLVAALVFAITGIISLALIGFIYSYAYGMLIEPIVSTIPYGPTAWHACEAIFGLWLGCWLYNKHNNESIINKKTESTKNDNKCVTKIEDRLPDGTLIESADGGRTWKAVINN